MTRLVVIFSPISSTWSMVALGRPGVLHGHDGLVFLQLFIDVAAHVGVGGGISLLVENDPAPFGPGAYHTGKGVGTALCQGISLLKMLP